jgi:hypothetical protein
MALSSGMANEYQRTLPIVYSSAQVGTGLVCSGLPITACCIPRAAGVHVGPHDAEVLAGFSVKPSLLDVSTMNITKQMPINSPHHIG